MKKVPKYPKQEAAFFSLPNSTSSFFWPLRNANIWFSYIALRRSICTRNRWLQQMVCPKVGETSNLYPLGWGFSDISFFGLGRITKPWCGRDAVYKYETTKVDPFGGAQGQPWAPRLYSGPWAVRYTHGLELVERFIERQAPALRPGESKGWLKRVGFILSQLILT